jgi:phosphoribosylglycinamide formyltransferase-1
MSDAAARLPIVVLVSGAGSNLRVIAERAADGSLPVEIRAVISDKPDAPALAWAAARGIAVVALPPSGYPDRTTFDRALADRVAGFAPGLVVLAGFMRILGDEFVDRFAGRLVNIHPSLLPKYRGLHTHRRALEAGDQEHGASVHFVTRELDGGPVVLQARVPVRDDDDERTLAARVLAEEHRIYPECIGWFAAGRLRMHEGAAMLDGHRLDAPVVREAREMAHG